MDFVLALHSHLPYVLNHGRWPHGSDWLCEAALDTYLPLLEHLHRLEADRVPAPVTIGVTPVLANQLASPTFVTEMETFFAHRLETCEAAPASLAATGEGHLLPVVDFWRDRLTRLREFFHRHRRRHRGGPARARGCRAPGDHRLGRYARLPSAPRPRREHSASSSPWDAPSTGDSSAGSRRDSGFPSAPTGRAAPGNRPESARHRDSPRHRGARGRRGLPLLLRRCAPGLRGPASRHLW